MTDMSGKKDIGPLPLPGIGRRLDLVCPFVAPASPIALVVVGLALKLFCFSDAVIYF